MRRLAVDSGHTYICIDLKCFYASVECADRGLDPFTTNLVVADPTRGEGTICLAISPAMKALGVRNRCRVFEIPSRIKYIKAMPRMRRYMEVSAQIYGIYLKRYSAQDIHVYSVDECFIDVTPYQALYHMTAREQAVRLMEDVLKETGICATAGIGTNLFLAKVALDITAKHVPDHIGMLNEAEFRRVIWPHQPITDIWGIGPGTQRRLSRYNVRCLRDITRIDERLLYKEFGINAEYLIDHAWGYEPCTMADIHNYRPQAHSTCNGQVLMSDYSYDDALCVLREMIDTSVLDLVEKRVVCQSVSLFVGYSWSEGGRTHSGATRKLPELTNSRAKLMQWIVEIYEQVADKNQMIRRLSIGFGGLLPESQATVSLFTDVAAQQREHRLGEATLAIKDKYGKNSLVRGISFREKATGRERNAQVGGHHE